LQLQTFTVTFSVKDQLASAQGQPGLHNAGAFWYVLERAHMLTGWTHNDEYGDYRNFPDARFGNCDEFDDNFTQNANNPKAPAGCVGKGGRSGYSVKIVSPDYLRTSLPLGGTGQNGTIMNPPPF